MWVFVRGYHSVYQAAGLDINAASTIISASKARLYPSFYIEVCRKGDPETQVNAVYDLYESIVDGGQLNSYYYSSLIMLKLM
jgi:hypothetical protein